MQEIERLANVALAIGALLSMTGGCFMTIGYLVRLVMR